ncbi:MULTISPECIES: NAD(+) diphosphatase [unclassified Arthrobacter]|uniref:NAD(+) diphosphatase n=1 Tax=unclassified Arthrobacter TaxID=235627 RepID=UPI001491E608|nr:MULTISPECIES: NAD(+) diphosphatase [unclassified Arthrobacter]MBE0008724.1 NAD(+) diphosphatase [Arthrobacter sp. AET 35A]NOJ62556.1 NAD(+) diphosphatase [Arthrobacter sp. 147(2020)]
MSETLRIPALSSFGNLPLARVSLDRGGALRSSPTLLDDLWGAPGTRVMFIAQGRSPMLDGRLMLKDSAQVKRPDTPIYLGRTLADDPDHGGVPEGTHILLAVLDAVDPDILDDDGWVDLRAAATLLSGRDAGIFAQAVAIANWHAKHTHCPRCGTLTEVTEGGWVRRCPSDGTDHYPRTDPAIIVAVVDEADRLLLGSAAAWPEGRFSTLAGFVEPGESLEGAVIREVAEESGIEVHSPQYLGSQPWPFPASLMLGFIATAVNTNQVPDGVEIMDVRWFTRSELSTAVRAGDITIPTGVSVSRALIEHWYGGPLDESVAEDRP